MRGESMLLAPILVIVYLASAAVDDDDNAAIQRRFTIVALVTLFAAYLFDVQNSNEYFHGQLSHLLPKFLYRFADRTSLIDALGAAPGRRRARTGARAGCGVARHAVRAAAHAHAAARCSGGARTAWS